MGGGENESEEGRECEKRMDEGQKRTGAMMFDKV